MARSWTAPVPWYGVKKMKKIDKNPVKDKTAKLSVMPAVSPGVKEWHNLSLLAAAIIIFVMIFSLSVWLPIVVFSQNQQVCVEHYADHYGNTACLHAETPKEVQDGFGIFMIKLTLSAEIVIAGIIMSCWAACALYDKYRWK